MSPSRLAKKLQRRLVVAWRDQLTRHDIEAMQANIERVGMVIRVRWALVAALAVYSLVGGWIYSRVIPFPDLMTNMLIPAVAMVFVLCYNFFYWSTYRRLGNIAILNHAQLLFDALVVTVLVYYSGGAHSWFWAMYSLFVLEAAFILPRRRDAWFVAGFCLVAVGAVIWGQYLGVLPHVPVPFAASALHRDLTFVSVRYLWEITVIFGTATVATLMTAALRRRETALEAASVIDDKTGLYDRPYFLRTLASELARAERDERSIFMLLVDIDDFDRYNRTFGLAQGDRILASIAREMERVARESEGGTPGSNIVARWGGEEFAILLTAAASRRWCTSADTAQIAEGLRLAIAGVREQDAGVTVSIGAACYPDDGSSVDDILTAVDEAILRAKSQGGNRVVLASSEAS